MRKERVTDDIYIFQSEMYAQVTAGAIVTDEGTIVIDTLPFPRETREMIDFLRDVSRSKRGIRYVINTHYHADHVYGNYLFTEADIISSERCREILRKSGEKNLNEAKQSTPELADVALRLPNLTFPDKMTFHLGDRVLRLMPLPGHTLDGVGIYIEGEKILYAGDAVMALPHIYWGDREVLINTLNQIKEMNVENIVQGHGDVLLKGEIDELYLRTCQSQSRYPHEQREIGGHYAGIVRRHSNFARRRGSQTAQGQCAANLSNIDGETAQLTHRPQCRSAIIKTSRYP
jgi:glyoxylase-like metal-dependent hydrolase (beta-lactamase superfamily II)